MSGNEKKLAKTVAVMIPARNEEKRIKSTINNLYNQKTSAKIEIVVVDDGSTDQTANTAKNLSAHVVSLPDRGYSALGRPELADTHNAGFKYILDEISDAEFIMVVGADTTFETTYIQDLLEKFQDYPDLAICAGYIQGERNRTDEVRGSGRMFRKALLVEAGGRLPRSYAWEPYLVHFAKAHGYLVRSFPELKIYTSRTTAKRVNWKLYGIGMKEMGYYWLYAMGRAVLKIIQFHPINGLRLIIGYVFGKPATLYPDEIRKATKKRQKRKIREIIPLI